MGGANKVSGMSRHPLVNYCHAPIAIVTKFVVGGRVPHQTLHHPLQSLLICVCVCVCVVCLCEGEREREREREKERERERTRDLERERECVCSPSKEASEARTQPPVPALS